MKKKSFIVVCICIISFAVCAQAANYSAYKYYIRALLESKSGEYDKAVKDYEKVVSLDSSSVAAHIDLMYLYWQAGNSKKAFEVADKIEAADGNNPNTTNALATFYIVVNSPEKIKKYLDKTLELDPENETATIYMAAYYYSGNELEKSAQYWNKFLKQQPESYTGYWQLGMIQEKMGMLEEALKSFDKVIALKPDAREAYLSKARVYENTGQIAYAIAEYEKYMEIFPENFYVMMYLGRCYFENKEYDKASDAFLGAKKGMSGAEEETASYWLGITYEKKGDIANAAREFEFLVSRQPANEYPLTRLGYYYSLMKQYSKAEKTFAEALQKNPLNYEVIYLQGLNYTDWGKYDKAIKAFEKVTLLKPDFDEAYFFLGGSYDKSGDFEKAEKALLRAIEINPNHARALNYLGYSYADRNINLDVSEKLLRKAVSLEPNNGAYLDSLGWLYYREERYKEAKECIISAIRLTEEPVIYEHLGDVYTALEKLQEAWLSYALACDCGGDFSPRKKKDLVEKKLSENDFYNALLFRTDINYKKLNSLKAGYKMKISSKGFSTKAYVPLVYVKGEGMEISVPEKFAPAGASIYINNGNISFEPKAVENQIPDEFDEIIKFAAEIFSGNFFLAFEGSGAFVKGKKVKYCANDFELILNSEEGFVEKITKKGIKADINKYKIFAHSRIPETIKISSDSFNFTVKFDLLNVSFSDKHIKKYDKNTEKTKTDENQNTSAGEN